MAESVKEAYERGKTEGQVEERLNGHEDRLNKINGSMDRVADKLSSLAENVQRLGDEAQAREQSVIATAAALEASQKARRDAAEQTWTPFQRTITVVLALCAVLGAVAAFFQ